MPLKIVNGDSIRKVTLYRLPTNLREDTIFTVVYHPVHSEGGGGGGLPNQPPPPSLEACTPLPLPTGRTGMHPSLSKRFIFGHKKEVTVKLTDPPREIHEVQQIHSVSTQTQYPITTCKIILKTLATTMFRKGISKIGAKKDQKNHYMTFWFPFFFKVEHFKSYKKDPNPQNL